MNLYTLLWAAWILAFVGIEGFALIAKDKPSQPHTLSAHVWWAIRGSGLWHHLARAGLVAGLGWLTAHLLG